MKIGGEYRVRNIQLRHWRRQAEELGLDADALVHRVDHLAAQLADHVSDVEPYDQRRDHSPSDSQASRAPHHTGEGVPEDFEWTRPKNAGLRPGVYHGAIGSKRPAGAICFGRSLSLAPILHTPRPMHILVVDDTASVLQITDKMLRSAGYEVTCVGSGEEAIKAAAGHQFDLILMDVVMDKMGGVEAARAIRLIRPVPIVYMTGFPDQLDALRHEIVVEKPFTLEKLLAKVKRVIKNSAGATSIP